MGFPFWVFPSWPAGPSKDEIIAATIPPSGRYDCSTWGLEDAEAGVLSDLLQVCCLAFRIIYCKLDPVGSTVRYEMMKLCTGSL